MIVPLLIVIYLTFRTSWGRLEDANRHVAQLNELYLSTIEALRWRLMQRTRSLTVTFVACRFMLVELARRLGVCEERQIKAIAAAALLHDMGKLAIPEHILNKPGEPDASRVRQMKTHAGIGC